MQGIGKVFHPSTSESIRTAIEKKLNSASSPWDRLPLLIQLTRCKNDPDYTYRYAVEAFNTAKELDDKFWTALSLRALSMYFLRTSQQLEAVRSLKEASSIFGRLNDSVNKAETDRILAQTLIMRRDYDTAMKLLFNIVPIFKTLSDPENLALTYSSIGEVYRIAGDHSKAIRYYHRALSIAIASDIVIVLGALYLHLAASYRGLGDTANYRRYTVKSLIASRNVNNLAGIAVAIGNLANSYIDQQMFTSAENYVRHSGKLYRKLGYKPHEATSWGRLGRIYEHKGELQKAFRCHKRGIALALKGDDKLLLGTLYESLGGFCMTTGRLAEGIKYLKKGVSLIDETGDRFHRHRAYMLLAQAYERTGETASALQYYKESNRIKEEYINNQKLLQASRAEISLQLRSLKNKLRKEESKNNNLQKRREEQEAKLVSLTLSLIQEEEKNRRTINCSIENKKQTSLGNWEIFARQFHKVYDTFYFKLIRDYPALTQMELKVCSLIRIGLSSKEISALLCISVRTVDRHREEIRKRLGLPPRFSLHTFIADL